MDTLFFSFANQQSQPLPNLQEEDDAINRLLSPRAKQQHFLLHRDSFVTLDKLPSYLTLYRDELVLFGFSGHAGRDALLLADGTAHAHGLAQMLGQCAKLKLVFLNGCSTGGQVAQLLAAGVPVVIATSAPVSDGSAAFFSTRFFEALQQQLTIQEAFDMAKGAVDSKYSSIAWQPTRTLDTAEESTAEQGVWGLFHGPKHAHVLGWKLPVQPFVPTVFANFTPNKHLIDTLFAALAPYNDEARALQQKAQRGEATTLAKKRIAVLNALPAPLAEPLRKLLVPVEDENEGYDKISAARLRQISTAYNTSMELLAFTLLAQLWEAFDETNGQLRMASAQREALRAFFRLTQSEREIFDFLELVRLCMTIFDQNQIQYFVEELDALRALVNTDPIFEESLRFLNGLRLQVRRSDPDSAELAYLSKRGEECLTYLYSKLGFLARYKLATIQGIDVEKYRHQRTPTYKHNTVLLHDLLGGLERTSMTIDKSLDNRSILLINLDNLKYLSLSPFVIDEHAFQDRAEICKLYFFSHYLKNAGIWCYKYIYKPEDPYWEVEEGPEEEPQLLVKLVKGQFDAFADNVLQQALDAL